MDEVCVKDVACGRGACLSVCARVRVFVWKRVRAYVRVCACACQRALLCDAEGGGGRRTTG